MVKLIFYGGVDEIGGNKVLLEDGDTKIFLDFGMGFKRRGLYFEEFLTPRTANGIGDFLEMDLLPDISGVYRTDLLKHLGRKIEEPDITGVVLSHAHADHANYISFLHKDIPIYCGETCKYILDAVDEQSQRSIESEVINYKERPIFRKDYRSPPIERVFNTFRTGKKILIDSLEVEPIHVDHCLTEDTLIQLSDGELKNVKDVAENSYINTIDTENGLSVQAYASKSKYKVSHIFKIKTKLGEIKSSGEHKFFTLNGLDIKEKKAKELKKDDFLIYLKKIDFKGKHQKLPKIDHRQLINVSPAGLDFIKQKRKNMNFTQKQMAKKVLLSKFYGEFERGEHNIDMKNLLRIFEKLNINKDSFIKKFVFKIDNITIPRKTSPELLQLLGFIIGDGSWYVNSKKSPYLEIADKDKKNLELYNKISKYLFNIDGKIITKHTNILMLSSNIGKFFNKMSPFIFSKSHTRKIPPLVHKATIKEIAAFLRGLYDAEGSFGDHTIILTSTSKDLIEKTKLLLIRFGIISWIYVFSEPISKRKAYQLCITHNDSIKNFYGKIGFGSLEKQKKLKKFLKKNKKSPIERVELIPFNGKYLKSSLKAMKMTSWDFRKEGINISHYLGGEHLPSKSMLWRISECIKNCEKGNARMKNYYIKKIEKILQMKAVYVPIKSIQCIKKQADVYDFQVPGYSSFLANGFLVHNSVPGSYGFIIHTSEGAVVYTGDLRMHGLHSEMTNDFINATAEAKPIAMITEGTRIDTKKSDESEEKVYHHSKQEIMQNKHLSIVDFNFKDIDRFTTFYRIAKELDKKLVISFKHACFLEKYHLDKKLNAPNSNDEHILLLKPKRLTGTYCNEDYTDRFVKKRLSYPNIITADEIRKNPVKYMVVLNYWYFPTLIDLKPNKGTYIHSLSEPFNEEMEISSERMHNWLNHFDLNFVQSHCSGHIYGPSLKELILKINPKTLFPIHTEHPELFKQLPMEVLRVNEQKLYKL